MGIKNINELLRQICPHVFRTFKFSQLKGIRLAIDISIIFHKYWAISIKQVLYNINILEELPDNKKIVEIWLRFMIQFLNKLLANQITPVIVFDGKAPALKDQHARKDRNNNLTKDINKYEEKKRELLMIDPLYRTKEQFEELNKYYAKINYASREDVELIQTILKQLHIPCLQAKGEAEELCSFLCRNGYVDLVYSTDTDNYAHGCPFLMSNWEGNDVTIICLQEILYGLQLSYDEFVDLCIMLKCDYNENIRNIGIKRAYELIKKYRKIEHINYDTTCLNYLECRQIFYPHNKSYQSLCQDPDYKLTIDPEINFNDIKIEHKEIESLKYLYSKLDKEAKPFYLLKLAELYALYQVYVSPIEYIKIEPMPLPDLSKLNFDNLP